jgi:hypothetical protein
METRSPFLIPFLVGVDFDIFFGFALPDQGRLVAARAVEMAVEAIGTHVELASLKPIDFRLVEIGIENLVPFPVPGDELFGSIGPETLRVIGRTPEKGLVFRHALDVSCLLSLHRGGEQPNFFQKAFDFVNAHIIPLYSCG